MMRAVRKRDEGEFHSLRGLILQLSANPEIDNETKFLKDFGSGQETPVYVDSDWWIVYRVEYQEGEEIFSVISIWEAAGPPNLRL